MWYTCGGAVLGVVVLVDDTIVTARSPVYTPAASPLKVGCTLTVAGCVALTLPEEGVAVNQFKPLVPLPLLPLLFEKDVARNVSASGDGLVIDMACAEGSVPPAAPTNISPVGCTKAPGLLAGETTFSTTDATCGEFVAADAAN